MTHRISVGLRSDQVTDIDRLMASLPNPKRIRATLILEDLSAAQAESSLAVLEEYAKGLTGFRWINVGVEQE